MFSLLKKLVLLGLIGWGLYIGYKKFIAPETTPFFQKHTNKVDFFGTNTKSIDKVVNQ